MIEDIRRGVDRPLRQNEEARTLCLLSSLHGLKTHHYIIEKLQLVLDAPSSPNRESLCTASVTLTVTKESHHIYIARQSMAKKKDNRTSRALFDVCVFLCCFALNCSAQSLNIQPAQPILRRGETKAPWSQNSRQLTLRRHSIVLHTTNTTNTREQPKYI